MTDKIDEAQMAADFASIPDRANGPYQKARQLVERYSSRIGAVHVERALIEEIATEIGLAELRAIPHRSDIEQILRDHFWTGEPGDLEAIEGAKKALAALFQQSRGITSESVENDTLITGHFGRG